MIRSAFDIVSAWASVLATTKSTPIRPAAIMLLTALPPAPPTPKTVIRAFRSLISVMLVMSESRTRIVTYKPCGSVEATHGSSGLLLAGDRSVSEELPSLQPCRQVPGRDGFTLERLHH